MHIRLTRRLLGLAIFAWLVGVASPAAAQPTADEVLAGLGLSADDKQRVLNGEFVSTNVEPVSERDLAVSIVFIVKTSPASLIKQVLSGRLITSDSQVQSWALFKNPGSAADLAGLTITNGEARTLARASPGSSLNLSRAEIAAFNAVPDGNPAGVLQTSARCSSRATRRIATEDWPASPRTRELAATTISPRICARPPRPREGSRNICRSSTGCSSTIRKG